MADAVVVEVPQAHSPTPTRKNEQAAPAVIPRSPSATSMSSPPARGSKDFSRNNSTIVPPKKPMGFIDQLSSKMLWNLMSPTEVDLKNGKKDPANLELKEVAHSQGFGSAETSGFFFSASYLKDTKLRRLNCILFMLSAISLITVILTNTWNYKPDAQEFIYENTAANESTIKSVHICKLINCLSAFFSVIVVIIYYYNVTAHAQIVHSIPFKFMAFFSRSRIYLGFLMEALFCGLFMPPYYVDGYASYATDKVGLLQFLRLYQVLRLVRDFSPVYISRHYIIASNHHLKINRPSFNWQFSFRLLFFKYPIGFVLVLIVLPIIVTAFMITVLEREVQPALGFYRNSLWYMIVTSTTVGYGDFFAVTNLGRVVASIQLLIGLSAFAMLTSSVSNRMSPTQEQVFAMEFLELQSLDKQILKTAALLIGLWWKSRLYRPNGPRTRAARTGNDLRRLDSMRMSLAYSLNKQRHLFRSLRKKRQALSILQDAEASAPIPASNPRRSSAPSEAVVTSPSSSNTMVTLHSLNESARSELKNLFVESHHEALTRLRTSGADLGDITFEGEVAEPVENIFAPSPAPAASADSSKNSNVDAILRRQQSQLNAIQAQQQVILERLNMLLTSKTHHLSHLGQ